jgi:hypothetical protein
MIYASDAGSRPYSAQDSPAQGILADHRPVGIPTTLSKIADKAILQQFQTDYVKALMPHQLGVGVKFAAELLIMGLRMTLHRNPDFVIVGIDMENAYKQIWREVVQRRHMEHRRLIGLVPYLRGKLGPRSPMWAKYNIIYDDEGLLHGGPILSSAFSFTIHPTVRGKSGC